MIVNDKVRYEECEVETKKHSTELKFPIQTSAFKRLIEKMYQIHLEKNQDYSPANITITGEIGVLIRIWDKFCRLCNLYGVSFPTSSPQIQNLIEEIEKNDISEKAILYRLEQIKKQSEFDFSHCDKKQPANEPLDDTWLDMCVYSVIGYIKGQNKWGR